MQPTLPDTIIKRLDDLVRQACPTVPTTGLLIGLSGGPDSVALLHLANLWAARTHRTVVAAHLNHRLRGKEADADAHFCQSLCDHLKIRLVLREKDPRALARQRKAGLEEAARILRQDFFREVLAENQHLHCIATGHHRDDQVETIVMRFFRGTGPDGMAGIQALAGPTDWPVIHPLLETPRQEILAWLEEINQPWRTDATNFEGDNTRSRLRRELMPVVRSIFGEGAATTPSRLAKLWQRDLDFLEQFTRQTLSSLESEAASGLSIAHLLTLHPALALRVLRLWLPQNGFIEASRLEAVHLENIWTWLKNGSSGGTMALPGGGRLKRDFNLLKGEKPGTKATPMRNAGDFRILVAKTETPDNPRSWGLTEGNGRFGPGNSWNLTCPVQALKGNLKVRNWQQGDRITPFGLDGSRKLSDLFREQKISADGRGAILVVEDDAGILWVLGVARAERTRLLPSGQSTVTITVAPRSQPMRNSNDHCPYADKPTRNPKES